MKKKGSGMNKVIIIATTLFILNRTKKFTTGCRTIAIMIAKRMGTIMPRAMYNNVPKAKMPMKKKIAFAYNGNFMSLIILTMCVDCKSITHKVN